MKKTLYTLLACTVLAFSLNGCGGQPADQTTQEDMPTDAAQTTTEYEPLSPELPPLSPELQTRYSEAEAFLLDISFCGFACDYTDFIQVDGIDYYRVSTDQYADYAAFEEDLQRHFTDAFIEQSILGDNGLFAEGENGGLYFSDGARGANIFYAGHTFAIDSETADEINFTATAYYANGDEPYDGDLFYTAPEDPENYNTQDYHFRLVNEDGQWKFDEFSLLF